MDGTSYIKAIISRDSLPFVRGMIEELERFFYPFGSVDIYHDVYDWFIIFDSRSSAIQAQRFIQDTHVTVMGYPIVTMEIVSDTRSHIDSIHPTSKPSLLNDINTTAKQILFEELADIFLKDIKSRIAGPCIYDFLTPPSSTTIEKPKLETNMMTTSASVLESDIVAHALDTQDPSIYKLPRFIKRKSISDEVVSFPSPPPPLSLPLRKSPIKKQKSSPSNHVISLKKKVNKPTSPCIDVEGESEEQEECLSQYHDRNDMPVMTEFKTDLFNSMLQDIDTPDPEEELWNQFEPPVELSKEWDPFCQTKDVEDLEYLRVALIEKIDPNTNNAGKTKKKKSIIYYIKTNRLVSIFIRGKSYITISKNKRISSYTSFYQDNLFT